MKRRGTATRVWIVVPVKQFAGAKSRMAPILVPAQRAELAGAMLGDVLETLIRSEAYAGILVVTGDAVASSIAQEFGASVLGDPAEDGTNPAVLRGISRVEALGAAGVAVVPGDIPLVTVAELHAVQRALRDAPVVLVPATRDRGTNILALRPPGLLHPAFGSYSLDRHLAAATAAGVRPALLTLAGAGHDVDVPSDLSFEFSGDGSAVRTRACLRRFVPVPLPYPTGQTKEIWLS